MKAIRAHDFGGPEKLQLDEIGDPIPGPGEVLVEIKAAGINPADTYMLGGAYAIKPDLPYVPGGDAAGTIEAVGDGVTSVAVGDRVLAGQLIAEAPGFVSVPLHAPTSGTVTAIEDRLIAHPSGLSAPCIVIATDGLDEWVEHTAAGASYREMNAGELLALIRQAGIAGMGGAGFPAAVKLATKPDSKVQTLIMVQRAYASAATHC